MSSAREIVRLAGPALPVLAAEPLYLLVDTAVVGRLGAVPLAGLAVAAVLFAQVTSQLNFLSYGTTARTARMYGSGRRADAVAEGVQATWLALAVGAALVVVGQLVARPVAEALGNGGAIAEGAVSWLRVALVGAPLLLVTLAGNGWMRGVQDTARPLRYVLAGQRCLGGRLRRCSCTGSARSPASGSSARRGRTCRPVRRRRRSSSARSCGASRGSLAPPRRRRCARSSPWAATSWPAASRSRPASCPRPPSPPGSARRGGRRPPDRAAALDRSWRSCSTPWRSRRSRWSVRRSARATRAGRAALAAQVTRYGLVLGVGFGVLFAALSGVLPPVFTPDAAVLAAVPVAWWFFAALQPVAGVVFAIDGVLLGAGDAAFLRTWTLLAAVVGFLPLIWASLAFGWGLAGIWSGLAAFMLVRLVAVLLRVRGGRWAVTGVTPT